jgi:hypothetical protein
VNQNQGQKANATGQEAEDIIAGVLMRKGCRVERQVSLGASIYGTPINADFRVFGLKQYPDGLIIECKWQSASGSVDEKFPYLVLNIKERFPLPTMVVLSGKGYKPGAEEWLRRQVDDWLVAVMDLEEFITWMMNSEAAGEIVKQTLW